MRNSTTPIFYELGTDGGAKSISITPSAAQQSGKFTISGVDPRVQDMRNYLTRFWLHFLTTFDPDAAGNAVSWDKLYKGIVSVEVVSQVLGVVYPHKHTRGSVLGHIIQVIALAYRYPQGARTQIPASTDTDVTIDLFYNIPMSHACLGDPLETAQWTGFFDGGTVEAIVGTTTVFDGDYAGAVIKAPTTLKCQLEATPSPREFIGVPFQWRERQIAGGGSSPVLKNVGGETSLNGVRPGCGLAALVWLSNATGIGLSGPDGVDNFTAVGMTWRGQKQIQDLDPYFHHLREQTEKRVSPIAGTGTTIMTDAAEWPSTMDATTGAVNAPSANAQQMFMPLIMPGRKLETSKVQRVLGDLQIDFQVTTPITDPHQFVSWELLEYDDSQVAAMASLGRFSGKVGRKALKPGGRAVAKNLRYTAIEFG